MSSFLAFLTTSCLFLFPLLIPHSSLTVFPPLCTPFHPDHPAPTALTALTSLIVTHPTHPHSPLHTPQTPHTPHSVSDCLDLGAVHVTWLTSGHEVLQERSSFLLGLLGHIAQISGVRSTDVNGTDIENVIVRLFITFSFYLFSLKVFFFFFPLFFFTIPSYHYHGQCCHPPRLRAKW